MGVPQTNPDNVDGYPDVAVGRVTAHTADDVTAYVSKVLAYESTPPVPATVTFVADQQYPGSVSDVTGITSGSGLTRTIPANRLRYMLIENPKGNPCTAACWGPDRIDIFGLGADDVQLLHKAWDGTSWLPSATGWEPLGGAFNSLAAAVAWSPRRLDIFAVGLDKQAYHKAWDGSAWQPSPDGWTALGGALQGPPVPGWTAATADDVASYAKSSTWVGYFGHGGVDEWGYSGSFFLPPDVAKTATGSTLPVVFAAGCETGQFTPGAPWHGTYVDVDGTAHDISPYPAARPGVDGPAIIDALTKQTWGLNCSSPCVSVSQAAPFATPVPRPYDLPDSNDPSCGYLWTIASAPGGGIAYIGEMGVAPDSMAQEMETYLLAAYAATARPILGDVYLAAQREYWASHTDDDGVQSSPRFYLSFVTLFADPSLRLHPLA